MGLRSRGFINTQWVLAILIMAVVMYLVSFFFPTMWEGIEGTTWLFLMASTFLTASVTGSALTILHQGSTAETQLLYLSGVSVVVMILALIDASAAEQWRRSIAVLVPLLGFNLGMLA